MTANWEWVAERLIGLQRQWAGNWIAVIDGEVVEAKPTAQDLTAALTQQQLRGATVLRCPYPDEPELVGLG